MRARDRRVDVRHDDLIPVAAGANGAADTTGTTGSHDGHDDIDQGVESVPDYRAGRRSTVVPSRLRERLTSV